MAYIDLHVHSTASDGTYTPEELVSYACEKALYAFALTDHDSVAGIPSALSAARSHPVRIIPGVEISSVLGGRNIHILGYNVDFRDPVFVNSLRNIAAFRDERNLKICAQLRAYGVDIDYDSFKNELGCRTVTRTHFAMYLFANGHVKNKAEAFDKYLSKGRPCYIPIEGISTRDAVRLITHFGGVPVLAHPKQYRLTDTGYLKMFSVLKDYGVRGIETMYSTHSHEEEIKFTTIAHELGMFTTGGSDFHGLLKPDIDLGTGRGNLMIPSSILFDLGLQ